MPVAALTCPECGAPLRGGVAHGLCPHCVLRVSLMDEVETAVVRDGSGVQPRRFGDYELLRELGRGGMGVVYEARQLNLNRVVALKMLLPSRLASASELERFRLEAEAVAALDHPNILPVYEVGELQGQPYFTMKLAEGGSLAVKCEVRSERDEHANRLAPRTSALLLQKIARAVHYAHQRGIQHRDLKPGNILLDTGDRPYVSDFGLAKFRDRDSSLTLSTTVLGSPAYMAPEQAAGNARLVTASSDVYGLGAILYELLTGRPPFVADNVPALLRKIVEEEPLAPRMAASTMTKAQIDRDLETICLKCLSKEPARRYVSAEMLAEELDRWLAGEPILARPVAPAERFWRWCRRHPALAGTLGLLLLSIFAGVGGIALQVRRVQAAHRLVRLNLYAADMSVASQAIERGDYGLAHRVLEAHRPASGEKDLRGFEWRLLWQRSRGDELSTIAAHSLTVTSVALSPDGRMIASGSQDHRVRIWNAATHRLLLTLTNAEGAIWSLAFTPDGRRLIAAGGDWKVKMWDLEHRAVVSEVNGQMAALSPKGPILAVSEAGPFWEAPGRVILWNYETNDGREIASEGRRAAFAPDGNTLAVAGAKQGVMLFDVPTGKLRQTMATARSVWCLAFSPDGGQLAATGWNTNGIVWKLDHGAATGMRFVQHRLPIWSAAFSPDGTQLATVSSDQTLRLWDARAWTTNAVLRGHGSEVWSVIFAPDGHTVVTGGKDRTLRIWSTAPPTQREPELPNHSRHRPFFSPDGRLLVTVTGGDGRRGARLWNLGPRGGAPIPLPTDLHPIGFAPDGASLICQSENEPILQFWSLAKRGVISKVSLGVAKDQWPPVKSVFSMRSDFLCAATKDGRVTVWQTTTGRKVGSMTGPNQSLLAMVVSLDGRRVALSSEREEPPHLFPLHLYDVASGRESRLAGHHDYAKGMAFSPDGRWLASASVDGTIKIWDLTTRREAATMEGHMQEASDVAFSPDGSTLASIENSLSVKLWHVVTRREVVSLLLPEAESQLVFAPDGRTLALVLRDDAVRLLTAPALSECRE